MATLPVIKHYPNAFLRHALVMRMQALEQRYWIKTRSIDLSPVHLDAQWRTLSRRHHTLSRSLSDLLNRLHDAQTAGDGEVHIVHLYARNEVFMALCDGLDGVRERVKAIRDTQPSLYTGMQISLNTQSIYALTLTPFTCTLMNDSTMMIVVDFMEVCEVMGEYRRYLPPNHPDTQATIALLSDMQLIRDGMVEVLKGQHLLCELQDQFPHLDLCTPERIVRNRYDVMKFKSHSGASKPLTIYVTNDGVVLVGTECHVWNEAEVWCMSGTRSSSVQMWTTNHRLTVLFPSAAMQNSFMRDLEAFEQLQDQLDVRAEIVVGMLAASRLRKTSPWARLLNALH